MTEQREKFILDFYMQMIKQDDVSIHDIISEEHYEYLPENIINISKKLFKEIDKLEADNINSFNDLYYSMNDIIKMTGLNLDKIKKLIKQNDFSNYSIMRGNKKLWLKSNIEKQILSLQKVTI